MATSSEVVTQRDAEVVPLEAGLLQNLWEGRAALERARSLGEIQEIKRIGDVAAAAKQFAQAQNLSRDTAAGLEIDAGRYLGELLAKKQPAPRGRKLEPDKPESRANAKRRGGGGVTKRVETHDLNGHIEVLDPPTLKELGITKDQSSQAQKLAAIPEKKYEAAKEHARRSEELSKAGVLKAASRSNVERDTPQVANNTGEFEWSTPRHIIDAAREAMGTIELDPASSSRANKVVCADHYFTAADDGLTKDWVGNVWLNPPYAASLVARFTEKLALHYIAKEVSQAIVLVNNAFACLADALRLTIPQRSPSEDCRGKRLCISVYGVVNLHRPLHP